MENINVGSNYVIHTVTHYYVGTVAKVFPLSVVLVNASWIADTGRATAFYADVSNASEIEVFPPDMEVTIYSGAIVVHYPALGKLPSKQK